jgi:hypothetical protein
MSELYGKNLPTDKLRTNVPKMLLAVLGLLFVAYYGTTALSSSDALWFKSGFSARPSRLIVYHDGQRTEVKAGEQAFTEIADAVQASLKSGVSHASGIGFSQGTLDDAYNMYVSLEAFFDKPVKLHATFSTGQPTQMLFPITGRHTEQPIVVLGQAGVYLVNAPVLKTIEPIRTALRKWGYSP